jgi:alpha-D-ribose 1-methylphosphonate 5-triphosphate synthase subunit PhnG
MQYAINTLQIELHKQLEAIRVVKRYQAHPEYGGCSNSYERNVTVLQRAITHLQSAEQGESPATDRQQLKAEIAALIEKLCPKNKVYRVEQESILIEELRQLSAV